MKEREPGEVAILTARMCLHRVERAHPAVLLQPHTGGTPKVLAGGLKMGKTIIKLAEFIGFKKIFRFSRNFRPRKNLKLPLSSTDLVGARQKAAHHGGGGAQCQRLGHIAHVADAAVRDHRHTASARVPRHVVHRGALGPSDSTDLNKKFPMKFLENQQMEKLLIFRFFSPASCVMQMLPLPMPTRSASAPLSMSSLAWRMVTTLPAITWGPSGYSDLIHRSNSTWYWLDPLEESLRAKNR